MGTYRYTDSDIKKIMKNLVIVSDTREKDNIPILKYFSEKKIPYVIKAQNVGDYGSYIKAMPEMGIMKDLDLPARIEKKAGPGELASNLQKSTEVRFKNELLKSKDIPFLILVKGKDSYEDLLYGRYPSNYKPATLLARLNSLKAQYGYEYVYLDEHLMGNFIYWHFYYYAMNYLKNLDIQIYKPEQKEITA